MAKNVPLEHHLVNLLTKPLVKTKVDFICKKLGMYNVYAPA